MMLSDPLDEKARDLVPAAHILAIGLTKFRCEFACLKTLDDQWWDFFVTVAGVFVASTRLKNLRLGVDREKHLMEIVSREFQKWNPKAIDCFEDCKAFFDRTYDGQAAALTADDQCFVSSDTIGAWVAWNVLDHSPSTVEERKLVRGIGTIVTHEMFSWWGSAPQPT